MNIVLKMITHEDIESFKLMQEWDNDNSIKHLFRPNFKESELEDITVEELVEESRLNEFKTIYMIVDGNTEVGYVSIDTNFKKILSTDNDTVWLGICVGNRAYRGKGVGSHALKLIENEVKELGKSSIELGVFGCNEIAKRLYKKNGYEIIGEFEDFTYYDGKWYKDIRMKKYIDR